MSILFFTDRPSLISYFYLTVNPFKDTCIDINVFVSIQIKHEIPIIRLQLYQVHINTSAVVF